MKTLIKILSLSFLCLFLCLSAFAQTEKSANDTTTTSQTTRADIKFMSGVPFRVQKGVTPRRLGFFDEIQAAASGGVQQVNGKVPTSGNVSLQSGDIPENVNLYYTVARSRAAFTFTAPLVLNSSTGAVTFAGSPSDVQLGNVDNTRDANKPVSNPQQQAFNLKADLTAVVPYSTVASYSALSSVTAPAAGFIKFVNVSSDGNYAETDALYYITPSGKIRKLATIKEN